MACGDSRLRVGVTRSLLELKTRSHSALMAGIESMEKASLARRGNEGSWSLH
jgi:hypothetical protein